MSKRYTHCIVYRGAPYHEGERGHIVSRHTSKQHANKRFLRESRDSAGNLTTFPLNHSIRTIDEFEGS